MTDLTQLADGLAALYSSVVDRTRTAAPLFPVATPEARTSRDNLLAYLALREHDLSALQADLSEAGLSSLGRLEGSVLTSLESVLARLSRDIAIDDLESPTAVDARWLLASRSRTIFGRPRPNRETRIMVTLDAASIANGPLLEALLVAGMDLVRINCAHDSPADWGALIDAVRAAESRLQELGRGAARRCRISMDLGGPKIRTGALESTPARLRIVPAESGKAKMPVHGLLDARAAVSSAPAAQDGPAFILAVPGHEQQLEALRPGMVLGLVDARGKERAVRVTTGCADGRVAVVIERKTALEGSAVLEGPSGDRIVVAPAAPAQAEIRLERGERLRIYRDQDYLGHPARDGQPASVGCTRPDALATVLEGHRVAIDDGKIRGVVTNATHEYLEVEVESRSARLQGEKGLNFPDSVLELPALTEEDRGHLQFAAARADAVALSFVHGPGDLRDLHAALTELDRPELPVIAKIETREGVHNLGAILLAGLELPAFGVMIARGDLAVETGFESLAVVQEDILCLCDAAHTPVIWATQVLESLAKSGLPARAEITDAAMGQRAECVMLNKGLHVLEAVQVLAGLLEAESRHLQKKRQVFREFTPQKGVFGEPAPAA